MNNSSGWLMGAMLAGAILAGGLNIPLWVYLTGLAIALAVGGLVLNRNREL